MVRVTQQKKCIVADRFSLHIAYVDSRAAYKHTDAFCKAGFPGFLVHLRAGWVKPHDIFHIGTANASPEKIFWPSEYRVLLAELDQSPCEVEECFAFLIPIPIEPIKLVVLAIGIVVSFLSATEFVAGIDHWHTER